MFLQKNHYWEKTSLIFTFRGKDGDKNDFGFVNACENRFHFHLFVMVEKADRISLLSPSYSTKKEKKKDFVTLVQSLRIMSK